MTPDEVTFLKESNAIEGVFDEDSLAQAQYACANCGQQINRPVENAEKKLKMATSFEIGKGIYYSILDHRCRSIDLCNLCYSVMQTYRYSLSKEERLERENRSNSFQG